jgi:hypothetical protein
MSIFVSIVSYRDSELIHTIDDLIGKCSDPENLYFGIVVQDFEENIPDFSHIKNCLIIKMEPKDAKGVGYARSLAMGLYNKQEYYFQLDSHMRFVENWDMILIDQLDKAKNLENNNRVIISSYPLPYTPGEIFIDKPYSKKDETTYPTRQSVRIGIYDDWIAGRILFKNPELGYPEKSGMVLACFLFSYGFLIEEVPYDPEISFLGEEICFSIRAWTRGWDIYSSPIKVCYHFYVRPKHNKIWKDMMNEWNVLEKISKEKQKKVLCGIEEGVFGVGDIRPIEMYEKFVGYNFKKAYSLKKLSDYSMIVLGG